MVVRYLREIVFDDLPSFDLVSFSICRDARRLGVAFESCGCNRAIVKTVGGRSVTTAGRL